MAILGNQVLPLRRKFLKANFRFLQETARDYLCQMVGVKNLNGFVWLKTLPLVSGTNALNVVHVLLFLALIPAFVGQYNLAETLSNLNTNLSTDSVFFCRTLTMSSKTLIPAISNLI